MLFTKTIKQFVALAMLVVFAFSITPQKNIHDFVAKHVDPTSCNVHVNLPIDQVENASIHCSFDQLVATSPFVHYSFEIALTLPETVIVENGAGISFIESNTLSHFDSRGPPII
jgi:hypothetical protein